MRSVRVATLENMKVRYTAVQGDDGGADGTVEILASESVEVDQHDTKSPSFFRSCRFVAVLLCWLAEIICYVDRINISVAIISMSEEMNWSDAQQGYVLGSFFYGYIVTQVIGGK